MDELRFRLGCHAVHRCELLDERRELVTHGAWLFVGQEGVSSLSTSTLPVSTAVDLLQTQPQPSPDLCGSNASISWVTIDPPRYCASMR